MTESQIAEKKSEALCQIVPKVPQPETDSYFPIYLCKISQRGESFFLKKWLHSPRLQKISAII